MTTLACKACWNGAASREQVGQDTLAALREASVIEPRLTTEDDVAFLKRFGILRPDVALRWRQLRLPDGTRACARHG